MRTLSSSCLWAKSWMRAIWPTSYPIIWILIVVSSNWSSSNWSLLPLLEFPWTMPLVRRAFTSSCPWDRFKNISWSWAFWAWISSTVLSRAISTEINSRRIRKPEKENLLWFNAWYVDACFQESLGVNTGKMLEVELWSTSLIGELCIGGCPSTRIKLTMSSGS